MLASAYLSVFDDWHLIGHAVASIAPLVDEIVVVDGAYAWMAPFLEATGRDPTQSDPRMREALAPFGAKLRWIDGIWAHEMEKRAAGFAACRHRYVYRIDADEVLSFDAAALARFFAGGHAVAEMEMPITVAPGLIRGRPGTPIERQALLFDRERVGPREHLSYLWLVLTPEERAQVGEARPGMVFPEPVAFNAHLTHWRPPASAVSRARFYVLNYLRQGKPTHLAPGFLYAEATGFTGFVDAVPPEVFTQYLMGHPIVAGAPALEGRELTGAPQTCGGVFTRCYEAYLESLALLNAALAREPRAVARGDTVHIDVSTPDSIAPFERDGVLHLLFSLPIAAAKLELAELLPHAPWETVQALAGRASGGDLSLVLPQAGPALRRTLRVAVWPQGEAVFLTLSAPRIFGAAQDGLIERFH